MIFEKVCDLCGRTREFDCGDRTIADKSSVHLNIMKGKSVAIYDYDICLRCALKVRSLIVDIQRTRPTKCDFCEFDRGPRVEKTPECVECCNCGNFRLKKRMTKREAYEWSIYKRYLFNGGE